MAQATKHHHGHDVQEPAIHQLSSTARILLMLGTAILAGEVAADSVRKRLVARRDLELENEDGETAD